LSLWQGETCNASSVCSV
jgi:hypothetical protein